LVESRGVHVSINTVFCVISVLRHSARNNKQRDFEKNEQLHDVLVAECHAIQERA